MSFLKFGARSFGSRLIEQKSKTLILNIVFCLLSSVLCFLCSPFAAFAGTATITVGWDPPTNPATGYEFCYGTSSGNYDYVVDVSNNTSCTISGLEEGTRYYFAAKAYSSEGVRSPLSEELAYTVPVSESISDDEPEQTADTDGDGISDEDEKDIYGTDPDKPDTDNDGISDGEEIDSGSDPLNSNSESEYARIWLEAEDGNLSYPFETASNQNASGGEFAWVSNSHSNSKDPEADAGTIVFAFDAPTAGDYIIWGQVKTESNADNSFFISVDEGAFKPWHLPVSTSWMWKVIDVGGPITHHLEAGPNTLTIKQREDGTKIDKILITNDLDYVPEGPGGSADETEKVPDELPAIPEKTDPTDLKLWLEAEDGNLSYPFETASNQNASGGEFAWVSNSHSNSKDPEADAGTIVFAFDAPTAGDYIIWGRVKTESNADNSFFISVDEGAFKPWHLPVSTSWMWKVIDVGGPITHHLEAGPNTLTIKQREDGTKIDKILITNDLDYVPEGLGGSPEETEEVPAESSPEIPETDSNMSISDLKPDDYTIITLNTGDIYYTDRKYEITELPPELEGLLAIQTANDDKKNSQESFLSFTVNQDVTLYVAYDSRATRYPDWLNSYTNTGLIIKTTDASLSVWRKEFAAGAIALPGNYYGDPTGVRSNYFILIDNFTSTP